jgi:uncharacterized protein YfiM (DUF2279 family)
MMSSTGGDEAPYERAWQEVEAHWEDDEVHRRFLALCSATGALAEAGRRYRTVSERDPARRARAQARLDAVLGAAFATLDLARPAKVRRRSRLFWAVCGLVLGLCGYVLLAVLRRLAP